MRSQISARSEEAAPSTHAAYTHFVYFFDNDRSIYWGSVSMHYKYNYYSHQIITYITTELDLHILDEDQDL